MPRGQIRDRSGPKGQAWELRVYAGGRRVTRTVRGTRKQAERALTALLSEVDDGAHTGPDAAIDALLARYLDQGRDWSAATKKEQARIVDRYLLPTLGGIKLGDLARRPERIDAAYASLLARLSPATVRRAHVVLHAALALAVRWRWIASNPADRVTPPRADPTPRPQPNPADVARVLEALRKHDRLLYVIVVLAAVTGMRRGELLALRWADIDLDAGHISVTRALSIGSGSVDESRTKTGKRRRVAIAPATVALLRSWRTHCAAEALKCGIEPEFLFGLAGQSWRPDSLTRRWRLVRKRHKLPDVTLRDLRHFVATRLLDEGVSVKVVQERLGHDRATTTLDIYAQAVPESDRAAAAIMERLAGL